MQKGYKRVVKRVGDGGAKSVATAKIAAPEATLGMSAVSSQKGLVASDAAGTPLKRKRSEGLAGRPPTTPSLNKHLPAGPGRSRGAAMLAAAGLAVPEAASPRTPAKAGAAAGAQRMSMQTCPPKLGLAGPSAASPAGKTGPSAQLPAKYAALHEMFGALLMALSLLPARGQRCTFENLRHSVEHATGRRFMVSHLAQLKHLFPELLQLEYVTTRLGTPMKASAARSETHLVVSAARQPGAPAATPGSAAAGLKQELARRLQVLARAHYEAYLAARGQPASLSAEPCPAWDPEFDALGLPEVPEAELPPMPAGSAANLLSPRTPATSTKRPDSSSTPAQPRTQPSALQRRLSYGGGSAAAQLGLAQFGSAELSREASSAAALSDSELLAELPEDLRQRSEAGTLPMSLAALREVQVKQAQHAFDSNVDTIEARRRSRLAGMLPKAFDSVRAAFQSGPCVKPLEEVLNLAATSSRTATRVELAELVPMLSEAVPEWLALEPPPGAAAEAGSVVRIRRSASLKLVRERLVAAAAGQRAALGMLSQAPPPAATPASSDDSSLITLG